MMDAPHMQPKGQHRGNFAPSVVQCDTLSRGGLVGHECHGMQQELLEGARQAANGY